MKEDTRSGQTQIGSSTLITVTVHLNYDTISCWRVKWRNYDQPRVLTNLHIRSYSNFQLKNTVK